MTQTHVPSWLLLVALLGLAGRVQASAEALPSTLASQVQHHQDVIMAKFKAAVGGEGLNAWSVKRQGEITRYLSAAITDDFRGLLKSLSPEKLSVAAERLQELVITAEVSVNPNPNGGPVAWLKDKYKKTFGKPNGTFGVILKVRWSYPEIAQAEGEGIALKHRFRFAVGGTQMDPLASQGARNELTVTLPYLLPTSLRSCWH